MREREYGDMSSVLSNDDEGVERVLMVTSWEEELSTMYAICITSQYSTIEGNDSFSSIARRRESSAIAGEGHSEE